MNNWILITNKKNRFNKLCYNTDNIYNQLHSNNTELFYLQNDNELVRNDQAFICSDDNIIVVDGIILNLQELKTKYKADSVVELVNLMREKNVDFFTEFRGPFAGAYYSDKQKTLIAFGNQTGDMPLFYLDNVDVFAVSNDLNMVVSFMKQNALAYHLNEDAEREVLTYGFMLEDNTPILEIKMLLPGYKVIVYEEHCIIEQYHKFEFKDHDNITLDQSIETLDCFFRKAIKRCFDKDLEYQYNNHLVDISAGLDSRMVNWVAKDMGYKNIVNISYSQCPSQEHTIASKISEYLGNSLYYKQLNDADFIYDLDEIIKMNYGMAIYSGITGGKRLLEMCNHNLFGLEHTGQLGDVVVGNYSGKDKHSEIDLNAGKWSNFIEYSVSESLKHKYCNEEEFLFYTRGFRGILSTHLIRRHYYYAVSPFLDIDLMEACFCIPMVYRSNHKLYWSWVEKKYPDAGNLPSTRKQINYFQKLYRRTKNRIQRECSRILHRTYAPYENMNPFDYWYSNNHSIQKYITDYYFNNKYLLKEYDGLLCDVEKLFLNGSCEEKLQALTVLGTLKQYFCI